MRFWGVRNLPRTVSGRAKKEHTQMVGTKLPTPTPIAAAKPKVCREPDFEIWGRRGAGLENSPI